MISEGLCDVCREKPWRSVSIGGGRRILLSDADGRRFRVRSAPSSIISALILSGVISGRPLARLTLYRGRLYDVYR